MLFATFDWQNQLSLLTEVDQSYFVILKSQRKVYFEQAGSIFNVSRNSKVIFLIIVIIINLHSLQNSKTLRKKMKTSSADSLVMRNRHRAEKLCYWIYAKMRIMIAMIAKKNVFKYNFNIPFKIIFGKFHLIFVKIEKKNCLSSFLFEKA